MKFNNFWKEKRVCIYFIFKHNFCNKGTNNIVKLCGIINDSNCEGVAKIISVPRCENWIFNKDGLYLFIKNLHQNLQRESSLCDTWNWNTSSNKYNLITQNPK